MTGTRPKRARLRDPLLDWYARHRRDLPWRRTSDPYAVWISEAMLQQTRVEVVIPYFERFLGLFPTPEALAEAGEEELLAAWSGLGYYRRARSLREAARRIVDEHGGRFPRTREEALALPGVGPYTAGAVLSIAHGRAEALVDGNVERVFARLFALEHPRGSAALKRVAWERAAELLPPEGAGAERGPGAWNQALMELGALVCTPRAPRCDACPLARECAAREAGRAAELPRSAPRRPAVDVRLEVLLVERDGRLLLARRPAEGRMAAMWECPTRELPAGDGQAATGLHPAEFPRAAGRPALVAGAVLGELRHAITHHRIRAVVRAGTWETGFGGTGSAAQDGGPLHWVRGEELGGLGLTGLTKKVLRRPFAAVR